ncbi:MAG: VOC family protein [Solibacillus sp.]
MYHFDHLVHFVEKPEQAIIDLQKEGLHVVAGGQHEVWGTYNSLSYFDLSYVELIGINNEDVFAQAAKQPYTLHESYENNKRENGFTRVALRTTTIEADAEKFKKAGFDVSGPTAFSRTKPDGTTVRWQLLHIGKGPVKVSYPFFIQWDEADNVRREQLTNQGVIAPHAAGALKITEVAYILERTAYLEELAEVLGAPLVFGVDEEYDAEIATIELGGMRFKFYRPQGDGPVWEAYLDHGQGIYNITLSGSNEEKVVHYEGANYIFTSGK